MSDHPHGRDHAHGGEHGHHHPHSTTHGSAHDHDHGHSPSPSTLPLLEPHAGRGRVLFFDAFAGVAGDMTVAALLDLGVPVEVVERAVDALGLPGVRAISAPTMCGAIGARRFEVQVEALQPERTFAEIDALISGSALAPEVIDRARRIFRHLGEAEAEVHRIPLERVHFHEVGAVDAIVDIVGAATCLEYVGAEVVVAPLPLGHGTVECRHGVLPLPAPATVLCLRGVPTYEAGIEAELVTPTGAAIVATMASRFERWPAMQPQRVGWGAGTQRLPDRPNALRVVLGESDGSVVNQRVVLAANVDDMSGELAAHAIEQLMDSGALDAWATPITMKKGRPAFTLSVLADPPRVDALTTVLLRETSSIGVRRSLVSRVERPRRVIEVDTRFGRLPVKVSEGPFGPPQIKPEFDACARAARLHEVPVREVIAEAAARAREVV